MSITNAVSQAVTQVGSYRLSSAEVAVQLQQAPRPKQVSLAECFVTDYQRQLNPARVRSIVKKFNIGRVRSPLLAKHPDGGYIIIDGQHTLEALRLMGFIYWPHAMVAPMGLKEQIERFIYQKDNEKPLKPDEKLNAAAQGYAAPGGESNPDFLRGHQILRGIEDAGWILKPGHTKARFPVTITLSTGVEDVFDEAEKRKKGTGQTAVMDALLVTQEVWPNDIHVAGDVSLHRALGKLERAYGPFTSQEKIILKGIPPTTFAQICKDMGAQDKKRDTIAEYLIKAVGKRRNKAWYAA